MRVELFDDEGNRYTVAFEGQVTREKALRILDLMELMGGVSSGANTPEGGPERADSPASKYDRLRLVVKHSFPVVWFTSKEVQSVYEQQSNEPIGLSTVATYLARMMNKGILMKTGSQRDLKYRVVVPQLQNILESRLKS
jgi:hypothetical protein